MSAELLDSPPNEDPLRAALLASLAQGQSSGGDLSQLLAGSGDERANLVLQWLQQQRARETDSPPDEADPTEAERELLRLEAERQERELQDERREREREIERLLTSLYAEVEALRTRNDTLAAALGACHLCFGDDPICGECGGRGRPGALPPQPTAFRELVAPAVERVRAELRSRARWSPTPAPGGDRVHFSNGSATP